MASSFYWFADHLTNFKQFRRIINRCHVIKSERIEEKSSWTRKFCQPQHFFKFNILYGFVVLDYFLGFFFFFYFKIAFSLFHESNTSDEHFLMLSFLSQMWKNTEEHVWVIKSLAIEHFLPENSKNTDSSIVLIFLNLMIFFFNLHFCYLWLPQNLCWSCGGIIALLELWSISALLFSLNRIHPIFFK